jgi:2-isopropylmalate synthase
MITLYDTTLRDGAQGKGISFSIEDKLKIAKALDRLGIDFIEAGFPASNPKDQEFFRQAQKLKLKYSRLTAFGTTVRCGVQPSHDRGLKDLVDARTKYVTVFGKSSDFQVKKVLRIGPQENLDLIGKTVCYLVKRGKEVFYDAEHFFDGFLSNPQYSVKTLQRAERAGAYSIILCDTNGGMMPWQISAIIKKVKTRIRTQLGIHCHNDSGVGIANSLIAARAGCAQVQGTVNGLGERCGNADILAIIANLY